MSSSSSRGEEARRLPRLGGAGRGGAGREEKNKKAEKEEARIGSDGAYIEEIPYVVVGYLVLDKT